MKSFILLSALLGCALAGLEDAKYTKVLSSKNFDQEIASPEVGTLVAFFAPWCGHCKSLEPTWTKVAKTFQTDSKCSVATVNADAAENKPLASRYGVQGFPTIKFIPSGGKDPVDYASGRTEEAFLSFLNTQCGTHRVSGGGLSELAGRIASLDALAGQYLSSATGDRAGLLAQAQALAADLKDKSAQVYLKTFEKLAANDEYLRKEGARLQKLLEKKSTLAYSKIEELQIKQNVLKAFELSKQKAASASSAAAETVESVKAEL